jgi:hypothetical protein
MKKGAYMRAGENFEKIFRKRLASDGLPFFGGGARIFTAEAPLFNVG